MDFKPYIFYIYKIIDKFKQWEAELLDYEFEYWRVDLSTGDQVCP